MAGRADHRRRRPPRPRPSRSACKPQRAAQRLHRGRPGAQRLGLLLRLLPPVVGGAAAVRRHRRRTASSALRQRRLLGGHHARPERSRRPRWPSRSRCTGTTSARALPMAVVQPGTGKVLAMAVNRHYSLADNPPGIRSTRTPSTSWSPAVAASTGYQSGSTFKMFTMLAALEAGKTAGHRLRRAAPAGHDSSRRAARPAAAATGARATTTRRGWTATAPCGTASAAR